MGAIIDELDDHEGYAARRLPDGTLTGTWTHGVGDFTAYVAGYACGWHSRHQHPPTEDSEELAVHQGESEHAVVELARQATRHRQDLARVLAWLGGQADRLAGPAPPGRGARGPGRSHPPGGRPPP